MKDSESLQRDLDIYYTVDKSYRYVTDQLPGKWLLNLNYRRNAK